MTKTSKKNKGAKKAETTTATAPAVDLSKLTVKQLKEALSAKKAVERGASFAESRAHKIAKSRAHLDECEEGAKNAQKKLDDALERRDKAEASLVKYTTKYKGTFKEEDVVAEMKEVRKAREASKKK